MAKTKDIKVKSKVRKGVVLTILACVLATVLVVVSGILVNLDAIKKEKEKQEKNYINKVNYVASDLLYEIQRLDINYSLRGNMRVGTLIDLSDEEDIDDYFYYFDDKKMLKEGKILVDVDETIKVISNVKIDEVYCVYKDNKFDCNRDYKADTDIKKETGKEYKIGDAVTLTDGSKWHVIRDSNEYTEYVYLLSDGLVSPMYTVEVDKYEEDLASGWCFDKTGRRYYLDSSKDNVDYWLNNDIKNSYKVEGIHSMGLLTANEYSYLSDNLSKVGLTSDYLESTTSHHWFFNHTLGNWWIYDNDDRRPEISIWSNGYDGDPGSTIIVEPDAVYGLRPTMLVKKDAIK